MYIDNQQFYDEICKSKENGEFTDSAYESVNYITNLICNKFYPYPIHIKKCVLAYMISEAEYRLKGFNENHEAKPNSAFNYFTEVTKRALVQFQTRMKYK